jgi:hypothetical protein
MKRSTKLALVRLINGAAIVAAIALPVGMITWIGTREGIATAGLATLALVSVVAVVVGFNIFYEWLKDDGDDGEARS